MALATERSRSTEKADPRPPIKSLQVLSSGSGEQHREHRYGTRLPQLWWVLFSQSWIELPMNYFLLDHRDGLVLFDTGLDPAIATDRNYISSVLGRFLLHRIFRLHISEEDRLDKVLDEHGVSAADVRKAVFSHLHFDHVGGISNIPQADLLVSEREWAQLSGPHPEHDWILREHIEIPGAKWQPIAFEPTDDPLFAQFDGVFDVAGDGSMILLPTPGHTTGSLSMLVRSGDWPPVLLIGDLAYAADLLMRDAVPGTGDAKVLRASFAKVRKLKEQLPDLVIVPSHDTEAANALAFAEPPEGRADARL